MTFASHIQLNNIQFSSAEILQTAAEKTCDPNVPQWEKELFTFLHEWFTESDHILVQTSGSTGKPKSIALPKSLMYKSAKRTIAFFGLQKHDRILLNLPCQFIAGKMMVVRAIVGEMNLIAIDPTENPDCLEHDNFSFGAMVPNQVFKLKSETGIRQLQNISKLLVGGSAISHELEKQISMLSNRVVSTYGMTETATHIAIRELSGENKSEYYQCLPEITVGINSSGCLQIHLPELQEPLQTNDLAEVSSPTTFKILGRADSVIISGGIKYAPEVIEKKIEHLLNRRFVISALQDEKLGEKLVLVIEGKPFETLELEQKTEQILLAFERPRQIIFIDEFPETGHSKLAREEIKQRIQPNG